MIKWNKAIVSTEKFNMWISYLALLVAFVSMYTTVNLTLKQKDIDALLEFKQLYLSHSKAVLRLECVKKVAPELIVDQSIIDELNRSQSELFELLVKSTKDGLSYDEQKALIVSYLKLIPVAERGTLSILLSTTDEQFKDLSAKCNFGKE